MIVSESLKFVFVAIPKTGTHSIRRALRPHMSDDDMEQVRLFEEKAFPIPELANLRHGHISLAQLKPHIEPSKFNTVMRKWWMEAMFDGSPGRQQRLADAAAGRRLVPLPDLVGGEE